MTAGMRLLVDTHLLLRAAYDPDRLGQRATALLLDPANELLFSAASIWEVAIKAALPGRDDFRADAAALTAGLRASGWTELPVSARHAAAVALLPPLHRDPFDRLLVAQASAEQLTVVTRDPVVARYPGAVLEV